MRLVFVNHAHPEIPHVSGMRTGYFAREMAQRGHRVVLLTCALPGSTTADPTGHDLAALLTRHDWRRPLVVAIPPIRRRSLELIRQDGLPGVLRRALTLWQFLAFGGVFADWHKAASGAIVQLAAEFKPDLAWATFGNTTNLAIAQQLGGRARCPWIMDIKDSWTAFIPRALRRPMAWRFRDAAGWTSNSRHHQDVASHWLASKRTEVIYSGVAEEFYCGPRHSPEPESRQLLLVGSIYDDARLMTYLAAVREWMEGLPDRERESVSFAYAGSDNERVVAALKAIPLPCALQILTHRSIGEFAALARASFANSYLSASFGFHHKLLELLICGRPVICYPSERAESKALASQTGTMFASCDTEAALRGALASAWSSRESPAHSARTPPWRWADFAGNLEQFFLHCLQERQR